MSESANLPQSPSTFGQIGRTVTEPDLYTSTASLCQAVVDFLSSFRIERTEVSDTSEVLGVVDLLSLPSAVRGSWSELKSAGGALKSRRVRLFLESSGRLTDRALSLIVIVGLVASLAIGHLHKIPKAVEPSLNMVWAAGASLALALGVLQGKRNIQARRALRKGKDEASRSNEWIARHKVRVEDPQRRFFLKDALGTRGHQLMKEEEPNALALRRKATFQTGVSSIRLIIRSLSLGAAILAICMPKQRLLRAPITGVKSLIAIYLVLHVTGWMSFMKCARPNESVELDEIEPEVEDGPPVDLEEFLEGSGESGDASSSVEALSTSSDDEMGLRPGDIGPPPGVSPFRGPGLPDADAMA